MQQFIKRQSEPLLKQLAEQYPVVTLTGPRQSGKTTMCRMTFPDMAYANLEEPDTREFITESSTRHGHCRTIQQHTSKGMSGDSVSHDREFLDNTTSIQWNIRDGKLSVTKNA